MLLHIENELLVYSMKILCDVESRLLLSSEWVQMKSWVDIEEER